MHIEHLDLVSIASILTFRRIFVHAQAFLAAHDSEVLGLDWARTETPANKPSDRQHRSAPLLASAGRDGFVHLFRKGSDAGETGSFLKPLETWDDHCGASVAAVRFAAAGSRLISCGGDRSVVVRVLGGIPASEPCLGGLLKRVALPGADCAVNGEAGGRIAAVAGREVGLVLLDVASGNEIRRCAGHIK